MILPDTNILIAYFNDYKPVTTLLDPAIEEKQLLLSIIAVGEFLVKATVEEEKAVDQMIAKMGVIPIDRGVMDQAVRLRKQVLRKTKRTHLLDCFIAATAKVYGATLLTFDRNDYPFRDIAVRQPEDLKKRRKTKSSKV